MEKADNNEPGSLVMPFSENILDGGELQQKLNGLVPFIIYTYDITEKKLNYTNNRVADILGFEYRGISTWNDYLSTLVFKDDRDTVQKEMEKYLLLKEGETYSYCSRFNHKNGSWRNLRTTGCVLRRDKKGNPLFLLFIGEDITVALEREAEIKALKDMISASEELLQFGTWSQDASTGNLQCSGGFYRLFGYNPLEIRPEINPEFYFKHVLDNDIHALQRKIKDSFENNTHFEHICTIKTGEGLEKTVSTKGKAATSAEGALLKFTGATRDITEQANACSELLQYKQTTAEREAMLESGSWEFDVRNRKLIWSPGMYSIFGYGPPADEASKLLTPEFIFAHQSQAEADRSKHEWAKIVQEKNIYIHTGTITAGDGKIKHLETTGKVIRNADNAALKVLGITKNITQLKEYDTQLERRLAELERSNKELEEFAYIASHDLQEPLRKISAFGNKINAENGLSNENRAYLSRLLAAAENMRVLINNLLDFSLVTQELKDYRNTDINKLLEELKTELELEISESGTVIYQDELPRLCIIPSQIKQLFSNIILNAIKFRKAGQCAEIGVTSSLVTEKDRDGFSLKKDVDYYKICVSDNGIGFEPKYADRIFKIFQRLHGKAEYPGTGVGLAICRKITDNHNGFLFATSTPGEGSTFIIILPVRNPI